MNSVAPVDSANEQADQRAAQTVVRAVGLAKSFDGRPAVQGIDLAIPAGGCFGFLGPNGAGKTTTLRMILGLSPPTGGELEVMGMKVARDNRRLRARIGVVPQQDNLDPDFTVAENLNMYARYFGVPATIMRQRTAELLEFAELTDRSDDNIRTLSGGMKRRLSIARALVNDPELIVLDEPTTGLDPQVRHLIWQRLRSLKSQGKTLLLTTHYMDEAERLCDQLVVMDDGRIVAQGSPTQLIAEHVESDVLELHGSGPQIQSMFSGIQDLRLEHVGELWYGYTNDVAPLLERLKSADKFVYLHRPANLEDVFLGLTGRDLRD